MNIWKISADAGSGGTIVGSGASSIVGSSACSIGSIIGTITNIFHDIFF